MVGKNWILAAIFLVTWNEYELKPKYSKEAPYRMDWEQPEYYSVETTTHTIKLATLEDAYKFVGMENLTNLEITNFHSEKGLSGSVIGDKAFNISVKEEGKEK